MNFGKLDEHSSKNHRGTGLGLSICKSLIELMGGTVTVESEVGVGTLFIVSMKTKCNKVEQKVVDEWLGNYSVEKSLTENSCFKDRPQRSICLTN